MKSEKFHLNARITHLQEVAMHNTITERYRHRQSYSQTPCMYLSYNINHRTSLHPHRDSIGMKIFKGMESVRYMMYMFSPHSVK